MSELNNVRWLQLSDFHVGKDGYAQRKLFLEILSHIRERTEAGHTLDFIFLTGDISNAGIEGEYIEFFESFFSHLIDLLGNHWAGKIFLVPGNHDVDRSRAQYFDPDNILKSGGPFFDVSPHGRSLREQFFPRFEKYVDWDMSNAPKGWLKSESGAFTTIVNVNGKRVQIVGLNTAWVSKDDEDRHRLSPGINLVEDALNSELSADLRIVLGHHPLSWMNDEHATRLNAIFAKHRIIYLHGHLHANDARYEVGPSGLFLALRCGAAFQGRTDDNPKWVNGLTWAEANFEDGKVYLQPMHWSPTFQEWKVQSDSLPNDSKSERPDWWEFLLPSHAQIQATGATTASPSKKTAGVTTPIGWTFVNAAFLAQKEVEAEETKILQYFDGRPPDWSLALNNAIPRRDHVQQVTARFGEAADGNKPLILLIHGAGGEGKSTVLYQVAADLIRNRGWKALWRHDADRPIAPADILSLAGKHAPLLLVVDDAHSIAQSLPKALNRIQYYGNKNIHFLLCARTIDWRADAKKDQAEIVELANYQEYPISGVTEADATQLVEAWSAFGAEGLSRLVGLDTRAAAKRLVEASLDETTGQADGALLGAMLQLRYGDRLKDKVRSILFKLNEVDVPGGTLLDAFALIAIMHAEGLDFLCSQVLEKALHCSRQDLRREVINPLANEAVVAGGGRFVLTRHSSIAKAVVQLLREHNLFGDVDEVYPTLARAAIQARQENTFVPELHRWDYDLPRHFLESSRPSIAVEISEALFSASPEDVHLRVNLSKNYRVVGAFEAAERLFTDYSGDITSRAVWTEWSVVSGSLGKLRESAVLSAAAMCDLPGITPPSRGTVAHGMQCLAFAFKRLFIDFGTPEYRDACAAVAGLGIRIFEKTNENLSHFTENLEFSVAQGTPASMSARDLVPAMVRGLSEALKDVDLDKLVLKRFQTSDIAKFEGLKALSKLQ